MPKIIINIKETILKESKILLVEKSYSGFTIRELSKRCNLSVGTIYNYFSTKDHVINAVFYEDWNKALKRMENINTEYNTILEKLNEVYKELNTFLTNYITIFQDISLTSKSNTNPNHLESLYKLINDIIIFEKEKGNVTSNLPIKTLSVFIVNNIISLCKDPTLVFDDIFSLINL